MRKRAHAITAVNQLSLLSLIEKLRNWNKREEKSAPVILLIYFAPAGVVEKVGR
jgi:hypothetical protein